MKFILITASARKKGTVNTVCDKLLEGVEKAGHTTEIINLHEFQIKHCLGCMQCVKTRKCVHQDDFEQIFQKVQQADGIILGAPVYCHNVPGILKDFFDRSCYAVIPSVDIPANSGLRNKFRFASRYLKEFGNNAPLGNKQIISVLACSNPISDFKGADEQIKKFADEMGIKKLKKIRCTDTLFQLRPKAIEKTYQKAYAMGAGIVDTKGANV